MIVLDYKDRRPLYEQVAERFQELILKGILPRDMQMPSVRNQAMQLSINPNTIQRAYSELERQGYIYSVKGKGSFVADISSFLDGKKEQWRRSMSSLVLEGYSIGISRKEMEALVAEGEGQHLQQVKGTAAEGQHLLQTRETAAKDEGQHRQQAEEAAHQENVQDERQREGGMTDHD